MPAGAHRLGARLPAAARRLSARALSPRTRACRLHARRRWRDGAFFQWRKRCTPISWWAPTASAPPCASNAAPEVAPLYAGYSAWRALIAESAFPADVHRELFEYMAFTLPPGEQFLGYPVAGPDNDLRPGHRRYNVVWYRPADEKTKLQWLLTDEQRRDACDLDPAAADPRARRSPRCAPMPSGCWRRSSAQVVRMIDEPILQPIYDLELPQHGVRPGGGDGRCGLRRAPACGGRRLQGGGRCGGAERGVAARSTTSPQRAQALRGGAAAGEPQHHRARAPSRRLSAGDPHRRKSRRAPAATRPPAR